MRERDRRRRTNVLMDDAAGAEQGSTVHFLTPELAARSALFGNRRRADEWCEMTWSVAASNSLGHLGLTLLLSVYCCRICLHVASQFFTFPVPCCVHHALTVFVGSDSVQVDLSLCCIQACAFQKVSFLNGTSFDVDLLLASPSCACYYIYVTLQDLKLHFNRIDRFNSVVYSESECDHDSFIV